MKYLNHKILDIFTSVHKEVREGKADPEVVEEVIFNVYDRDEIYEEVEANDLLWKQLQDMEKYMNKHNVFYVSKDILEDKEEIKTNKIVKLPTIPMYTAMPE